VSVIVSACDAALRPALGRALACEASGDGRLLTVYLEAAPNACLLAAMGQTGRLAVVLTKPSTHRSIQVKGTAIRVAPADPLAFASVERRVAAFARDVELIGFGEAISRTLMAHDPGDMVAVTLEPTAIFDQTPGPRAGCALTP
jgi:hypothetical protein